MSITNPRSQDSDKPRLFGITGWKNSGKTTLVCQLIPRLKARGLKVATIKHTHHDLEFDQEGKDSFKHREAGAERVLIASRQRLTLFEEYKEKEQELAQLIHHFSDIDILLIEGFKQSPPPKLQVYRQITGDYRTIDDAQNVTLVASDQPDGDYPLPCLPLSDVDALADYIETHACPL
jgi:molybdopterin-guanine dinucleotide biosynthesis protein B